MAVHMGGLAVDVDSTSRCSPPMWPSSKMQRTPSVHATLTEAQWDRLAIWRASASMRTRTCRPLRAERSTLGTEELAERWCSSETTRAVVRRMEAVYRAGQGAQFPGVRVSVTRANYTDLQACIGRVQLRRRTSSADSSSHRAANTGSPCTACGGRVSTGASTSDIHARHLDGS